MRLTKFGHACVRLEHAGGAVVIDPGMFTGPEALEGADALLITHEHMDHFSEERVRAAVEAHPGLRIWTNHAVAPLLEGIGAKVTVVGDGDAFDLDGLPVTVHGEWHEVIHPDIPRVRNVGFLLGGRVFHPGDSFTVPPDTVDTLLLPLGAPWLKAGELVDYVREARPRQAVAIHEGTLSEIGQVIHGRLLGPEGPGTGGADYRVLAPGESVDVP
ncbi:MBL fold metallo-hydrolase [Kitasatospora sp. NPDC049285]|uniref:MBL fold metallo-hydrolase n=1 Tax=Kitasatospora sp. NPDC049285 TaxID=3157096 RepID=UPI0034254E0B